jgi:cobalt-zinc-cadmium efflux system protein
MILARTSHPASADHPSGPNPRQGMTHDHHHGAGCGHGHGHAHGLTAAAFDRAMAMGVTLNIAFVIVEVVAGAWAGSLALLADAGHNAGDVVGLLLAWGASWLARRPPTSRYTWGFRRATIYAALANAILLLIACGAILWEAIHRLREPEPVAGWTVIAVAVAGAVVNAFAALLFARGHGDVNVRAAYLHMAADAAVSLGVALAGVAIAATGWTWIDPVTSIVIAAVIVVGTWGLFRESVDLALDAVPRGVDPEAITSALAGLDGVTEVHDFHVWGASTSETSLSAHLVVSRAADRDALLEAAHNLLRTRFGVAHATIQIEGSATADACRQRPADTL